mmetsp:Transcript_38689/g.44310  ORF Transcript_38689/g.44310 Transcript_38689/m.44310 type:complete len:132 (-) Transcript_38689:344-739(-)
MAKATSISAVNKGEGSPMAADGKESISYKTIKKLSKRYKLPVKDMYELVTKFNSLVKISEEVPKGFAQAKEGSKMSPEELENKGAGIKISYLVKYWPDKHPDVIPSILKGVGIDTGGKDPRVTLKEFLTVN